MIDISGDLYGGSGNRLILDCSLDNYSKELARRDYILVLLNRY